MEFGIDKKELTPTLVVLCCAVLCCCNSVETAKLGDRTTNPGIVMPERYASSQRDDSLARVVITPVRHTHTRLHTPLSNICTSPSSLQLHRALAACSDQTQTARVYQNADSSPSKHEDSTQCCFNVGPAPFATGQY